ncbi:hypothetical protein PRIPAC_83813 [Pristionchus pacificus]|uniref:Uncharacterized protein n=1 Tax=Pristionchus pacificus TaxID=54126 RepID=A0A2A6BMC7_PRIPA|nr:hypothetical protein PRIPAC_83813 [Pristionchus pacificus]|eukprot:PDM67059.1 hypothetical protein PRIPAC_48476 [Pristionchus pacificus]
MLNSTLFDDVKNCFEEMKNPDNLIMDYFSHGTCGDLARRLAMDWLRIRSPKIPKLLLKRRAKMGDSVAQKMIRISEDEENISSVCSIMEDNEEDEEFNPFTANDNVSRAPTAKVSKRAYLSPSTCFNSRSTCPKKLPEETPLEEISQRTAKKAKERSPSSTSPSTVSKKASEEARIAEISQRIAQNKAAKDAKHRKTVVISDHDYTAKLRRSRMSK